MSESTKAPISTTAVTAVALAIGAALLIPVAPRVAPDRAHPRGPQQRSSGSSPR